MSSQQESKRLRTFQNGKFSILSKTKMNYYPGPSKIRVVIMELDILGADNMKLSCTLN
jgi:hypothetical protein